jgi:DNA-binding CsgD family transcriptional regulator
MRRRYPFLSVRQKQVILLVGSGLLCKEIAERLGIKKRTVSFHLEQIYRKLGIDHEGQVSRYKLLIWARDNRIEAQQ